MKGFTLIEVVIIVAIVAVVTATGFISLGGYRSRQHLKSTVEELVSVVKEVQNRSITQKDGKKWGIRFTNATSGPQQYEIFSGASYSTSAVDRLYSLGRNVKYGEPASGFAVDQIFSAIKGELSSNKIISLITGRKDGFVGDIILHQNGLITNRVDNDLRGYWHLDENTATTTYDTSGFVNSGTLTNGPTWTAASGCKAGTCLSFDGTDDYVNVGNPSLFQNVALKTISFWTNINAHKGSVVGATGSHFLNKNDIWFVGDDADNNRNIFAQNFSTTIGRWSFPQFSLNVWHNVVVVYDRSSSSNDPIIYVDGISQTVTEYSTPVGSASSDTGGNLFISRSPVFDRWVSGLLDEVRIYNRALSATEILNLYNDLK